MRWEKGICIENEDWKLGQRSGLKQDGIEKEVCVCVCLDFYTEHKINNSDYAKLDGQQTIEVTLVDMEGQTIGDGS